MGFKTNYKFSTNNTDNGYLSWSAVLELEATGIFAAEALAKGVCQDENNYGFCLAATPSCSVYRFSRNPRSAAQ